MSPFRKLSVAGFAPTAITYGPARMGFGLFLSELRAEFALSAGTAGLISGIRFPGMFAGLTGLGIAAAGATALAVSLSGLPDLPAGTSPAILFLCFGIFGLTGLAVGRIKAAMGLSALLRVLLLCSALSLVLMALAPTSKSAVLIAVAGGSVLGPGTAGAMATLPVIVPRFVPERPGPA